MHFNAGATQETTIKTTKETTKEKNSIQEQLVPLMKNNPNITAEQIANEIKEITANGVRYHIRNSTKSGKWVMSKLNK